MSATDDAGDGTERPGATAGPGEVYCRDCGATIAERAEICPECGIRQRSPGSGLLEELAAGGDPVVAALLSAAIPGAGQIYNRELYRGLAFIVASVVAAFSALVLVGFVLYPAVWLYAIYDAYTRAERATA